MNRRSFFQTLIPVLGLSAIALNVKAQDQESRKSFINRAKCVGCGDCIRACPVQAISFDKGKAHVDREKCIGCHLCHITCSYGAPR